MQLPEPDSMTKKFPDHGMLEHLAGCPMEFRGNFGGVDIWTGYNWRHFEGPCLLALRAEDSGAGQSWCSCEWFANNSYDFPDTAPSARAFAIGYSRAMAALFR